MLRRTATRWPVASSRPALGVAQVGLFQKFPSSHLPLTRSSKSELGGRLAGRRCYLIAAHALRFDGPRFNMIRGGPGKDRASLVSSGPQVRVLAADSGSAAVQDWLVVLRTAACLETEYSVREMKSGRTYQVVKLCCRGLPASTLLGKRWTIPARVGFDRGPWKQHCWRRRQIHKLDRTATVRSSR